MLLVTLSLSFLCTGWGGHYLVKTREPNITNPVRNKGHNKDAQEHGEDYQSDYYGSGDYDDYYDAGFGPNDKCGDVCNLCSGEKACLTKHPGSDKCCGVYCESSKECGNECPVCKKRKLWEGIVKI